MIEIIDFISAVLFFGSIPIAIFVGVVSYYCTSGTVTRKLGASLSYLLGSFIFSAYSGFVLLFRDGFHPDGVKSTGIDGVVKSLPDVGLAILFGGTFAAIGWAIQTMRSQSSRPRSSEFEM